MKAIMMSIRPQWVAKILNGEKTIEIRKKFPKDYVGWVYIYATKQNDLFKSYIRMGYYTTRSNADDLEYNGKGKVVARFWCDKVEEIAKEDYYPSSYLMSATMWYEWHTKTMDEEEVLEKSCLSKSELSNYLELKRGYAIHITKLEIFDKPKDISEFYAYSDKKLKLNYHQEARWLTSLNRAPQSWCYIEV